jgi:hypothetical protein
MRTLRLILLCILLISGGFLCYKEELVGEYYLSEETRSLIPFAGYEKLVFVVDSIDMTELLAGHRSDSIHKLYIDEDDHEYIFCESDYIYFSNSEYAISLRVGACIFDPTGIGFHFVYLDSNYMYYSDISVNPDENTYKVVDSLMVNGSWIHEVLFDTLYFVHTQPPFPSDSFAYPTKCYYSKTLGVVRIDFADGSLWELKEIVW